MNMNTMELNTSQLEMIFGGGNPTPSKLDAPVDEVLNGKNYDWIAQLIADWLNGDNSRSRSVNNDVDIYDTAI